MAPIHPCLPGVRLPGPRVCGRLLVARSAVATRSRCRNESGLADSCDGVSFGAGGGGVWVMGLTEDQVGHYSHSIRENVDDWTATYRYESLKLVSQKPFNPTKRFDQTKLIQNQFYSVCDLGSQQQSPHNTPHAFRENQGSPNRKNMAPPNFPEKRSPPPGTWATGTPCK